MPTVVGVRFKDSGKIYHFTPGEIPMLVGDWVVVETARGPELARVGQAAAAITDDQVIGELKPVLRRASDQDFASLAHYQQYLADALAICIERVREHRLPMNMIKAEYNFDGSRLTFFFTSEKRVDFRVLVRDLARTFHTRIELRQVGPRDEAKLLGGVGPCGRPLCCSTFLPEFAQVSIKMAKDQDLPLNPIKVSGVCGRLLCCLSYEQEQYLQIKAELPHRGAWVQTPEGPGEVVSVNVVRETVTVQLMGGTTIDCTAAQIAAVTGEVAAEARSRNAAGITPASQLRPDLISALETEPVDLSVLEDLPSASTPPVTPPNRPPARSLRPEALLTPTNERSRNRPPRPAGQRPDQRSDQRLDQRPDQNRTDTPRSDAAPPARPPQRGSSNQPKAPIGSGGPARPKDPNAAPRGSEPGRTGPARPGPANRVPGRQRGHQRTASQRPAAPNADGPSPTTGQPRTPPPARGPRPVQASPNLPSGTPPPNPPANRPSASNARRRKRKRNE